MTDLAIVDVVAAGFKTALMSRLLIFTKTVDTKVLVVVYILREDCLVDAIFLVSVLEP